MALAKITAAPTGVYAAGKVEALVAKWRARVDSLEATADQFRDDNVMNNWIAGQSYAFINAIEELQAALAALAEKAGR